MKSCDYELFSNDDSFKYKCYNCLDDFEKELIKDFYKCIDDIKNKSKIRIGLMKISFNNCSKFL